MKNVWKFVKRYSITIIILLLAVNSFLIGYNYYKKNETNKYYSSWFKSNINELNNENIDNSFRVSLFNKLTSIKEKILSKETLDTKYITRQVETGHSNFYNEGDVNYDFGLLYIKKTETLKPIPKNLKAQAVPLTVDNSQGIFSEFVKEIKSNVSKDANFNQYSFSIQEYLNLKPLSIYFPELKIGKIYMASYNQSMVIYPYSDLNREFNPSDRYWWQSAFGAAPSEFFTNRDGSTAGLTVINADIDNKKNTDLVRTFWYKFENLAKKEYIICIDLLLENQKTPLIKYINLPIDISLIFIQLLLLVIFCILYYFRKDTNKIDTGLYRLQRVNKIFVSDTGSRTVEIKVRGAKEVSDWNKTSFGLSWSPSKLPVRIETLEGHSSTKTQGSEITISKRFDLSLTTTYSTKGVEIWRIEKISTHLDVAYLEVLWIPNTQDEVKIEDIFWDTSLELFTIKHLLKEHVLKSESPELIYDPQMKEGGIDKVFEALKTIPPIASFYIKANAFSKRKFDFEFNDESIAPFIKQLYENRRSVKAVCSVEFLRKLVELGKVGEILNIDVSKRIIIETPDNDLKEFSSEAHIKEALKPHLLNKPFLVKKINSINEIAYRNRDFVVIEFDSNVKCVLITSITEGKINAGWISWREVDINYYSEIFDSLEKLNGQPVEDYLRLR